MPSLTVILMLIGAAIILVGLIWLASMAKRRSRRPAVIDPDEDLKQTCELNYTPE